MKYFKKFDSYSIDVDLPPIKTRDNDGEDGEDRFYYSYTMLGLRYYFDPYENLFEDIKNLDYNKFQNRFNKFKTELGYLCIKSNRIYRTKENKEFYSFELYLQPYQKKSEREIKPQEILDIMNSIIYENIDTIFKYFTHLDCQWWEGSYLTLE